MKIKLLFFVCIFCFELSHSQQNNCADKLKEFSASITQREFLKAKSQLVDLVNECPFQNENLYNQGVIVLQYQIDKATPENKEEAINELLNLYDTYDKNFPNNKNGNLVKKAMVLQANKIADSQKIFALLDAAFLKDKYQFNDANALYIYFNLFMENVKSKSNTLDIDQLLKKNLAINSVIDAKSKEFPNKSNEFANAKSAINTIVKNDLNPQNLIALAEKNFDANNQNIEWLQSMASLLFENEITTPIFGKIALQLNKEKPSSKSAFYLANYFLKNNERDKAISYYNQSISLEKEPLVKAKTSYLLASLISVKEKANAKKLIYSAIENDPTNGKYYIFLANLYTNSVNECGTTTIDKKAIYKLATIIAKKSVEINPMYTTTAEAFENEYSKNKLTDKELAEIKKTGGKITIGCWINETIQF
jgi:tetratricopeptide (TPR) repeat protein